MSTDINYRNSLLYLSHLLMSADDVLEDEEINALKKICQYEGISEDELKGFLADAMNMPEKTVYNKGIEHIDDISDELKTRVFAWLHRISEVDGTVHVKEVRFLLYSVKRAGIEFDDVVKMSGELPPL